MKEIKKKELVKLNLGSGIHVRAGWVNVDAFITEEGIKSKKGYYKNAIWEKGGTFVQADIMKLPFKDNYADRVEMHQVLEHLPYRDIIPALQEVRRVMKKGAVLIIDVPNFDALVIDYLHFRTDESFSFEKYLDHTENFYGVQTNEGEFHRTLLNPILLNAYLNSAGFTKGTLGIYPKGMPVQQIGELAMVKKTDKKFYRHGILWAEMVK